MLSVFTLTILGAKMSTLSQVYRIGRKTAAAIVKETWLAIHKHIGKQ